MQHYISVNAPRRLQISDDDLAECVEAVKNTTHPSAFLPAFLASEAILRSQSHPEFIRASLENANKPRLVFIRILASLAIFLGFVLSILLILSPAARAWRVASLLFWWPAVTALTCTRRGICLSLYIYNVRQIRPWEVRVRRRDFVSKQVTDDDDLSVVEVKTTITSDEGRRQGPSGDDGRRMTIVSSITEGSRSTAEVKTVITSDNDRRRTASRTSSRSGATAMDPRDKTSMQIFGDANRWEQEAQAEAYAAKSTGQKIWDYTVKTQNRHIRLLQDRTVLLGVCWGGALSATLTIALLWIPPVDLF